MEQERLRAKHPRQEDKHPGPPSPTGDPEITSRPCLGSHRVDRDHPGIPDGGCSDCRVCSAVQCADRQCDMCLSVDRYEQSCLCRRLRDSSQEGVCSCHGDDVSLGPSSTSQPLWRTFSDFFYRSWWSYGAINREVDKKCYVRKQNSTVIMMLLSALLLSISTAAQARGAEPRRETAYACEGKTLKIECPDGDVIQLIRANYGRFSITICNDHGNTEWSVNCMSGKSLRVLRNRCTQSQNCTTLASAAMFGDPCPNTLKYLEAHYECVPAAVSSSTIRPSPPWLITSQPSVWRSTVPTSIAAAPGAGAAAPSAADKPRVPPGVHHLSPPTYRPHITMPADLRPGVIKVKNDGHSPEIEKPKLPTEVVKPVITKDEPNIPEQTNDDTDRSITNNERPHTNKDSKDGFTEAPPRKDEFVTPSIIEKNKDLIPLNIPHEKEFSTSEIDNNKRHHHHNHHDASEIGAGQPLWRHCPPQTSRGLQWNWTSVDGLVVQQCPVGTTGLARWRCVSSAHRLSHLQQQRRMGSPNRDKPTESRIPIIFDTIGVETLHSGDSANSDESRQRIENLMLPEPLASSSEIIGIPNHIPHDAQPVWISEYPDLSECRSLWLNSLELRLKEGDAALKIGHDLSQVTSSNTLYGGDMTTTTNIIKRLAQQMSRNIQPFSNTRHKEDVVTELLYSIVRTGSNLLDISQQASWKDLSHPAQMRAATNLLIGLEENAFLLAGTLLGEKSIVHQTKNILMSITALETRNVETEVFPAGATRQKWTASQDSIYLPRAALIDNSEGGLVRIVFVAFDRLEEILQPPQLSFFPVHNPLDSPFHSESVATGRHPQMNSDKDRENVTRIINSKVISASLGKGRHIQLSEPVRLTLQHLHTENVTNPTCVFWDYTENIWSTEGCHVEWTNSTHTGCQCTHLTNFALLMDVHSVPLSPANALALNIITRVGCTISVISLLISMIAFQCIGSMKSDRVTIHKNLCACLLIAELIFMFGIEQTDHRVACGIIAGLLHYFFLAAFAWMFLEGFQLYAMLVEVFEPERARARWYYLFAYLIPLLIVGISGLVDHKSYGTLDHCWLSTKNYFHMSFIGPAALVLMANWFILGLVLYMMCRHSNVSIKTKENNKLYKIRTWLRSSAMLVVLLGLTWTFGLLYINQGTVVMAFIFTILNSLQGLFIFVFHCLKNELFQKECGKLGRRHPWLSCCLPLAPEVTGPIPVTASSSGPGTVPQQATAPISASSSKQQRYNHNQDHAEDQSLEDVSERDHPSLHMLKQQQEQESARSWNNATMVRPSAPPLLQSQNETSSAPHSLSMPSIHNNSHGVISHSKNQHYSHSQNQPNRIGTPVPAELQHDYLNNVEVNRSRSPSCFSVKMASNNIIGEQNNGWGVVQNPLSSAGVTNTWKNTSSKHQHQHQSLMGVPQPPDYNTRRDNFNQYPYEHDTMRGASYSRYHHHSNMAGQYADSPHYPRNINPQVLRDEPEYEEIDRNETMLSDVSDDNSGHGDRFIRHTELGRQGGSYNLDSRPLISHSPGEPHKYEHSPVALVHPKPQGRFDRYDSYDRNPERRAYDYHPRDIGNPGRMMAVLRRDNNVVCQVEPHAVSYNLNQGHGHMHRPVPPPYSDC